MPIAVTQKKQYENNPMPAGINPAVISDLAERDVPDFNDPSKMLRKIVARYVNEDGQEASRFYTPSLHEKATLRKDLIGMGVFKANNVPSEIGDLEQLLVGRQAVVVIEEGVSKTGAPTAKITGVTKPMPGQKVVAPVKGNAVAAPAATKAATRKAAPAPVEVEDGTEVTADDIPW